MSSEEKLRTRRESAKPLSTLGQATDKGRIALQVWLC